MTAKKQSKRPRPSYEEGRLRDKSIEKMQQGEKGETRRTLMALIKKAIHPAR